MEESGNASPPVKRSSKATAAISHYISKINEDAPTIGSESEASSEISVDNINLGDVPREEPNLQSLAKAFNSDGGEDAPKRSSKKRGKKAKSATPGRERTAVGASTSEGALWDVSALILDGISEANRVVVNPLVENVSFVGVFVAENVHVRSVIDGVADTVNSTGTLVADTVNSTGTLVADTVNSTGTLVADTVNSTGTLVADTANSAGALATDSGALTYVYDTGALAGTIAADSTSYLSSSITGMYSYSFGLFADGADDQVEQVKEVKALVQTGSPYP